MRAIEVRQSLRSVLLSRTERTSRAAIESELRLIIQDREKDLNFSLEPPDGRFVTESRDTLVVFSGNQIVAAVSIEVSPRLENLVISNGVDFPEVIREFAVNRAEGVLMQIGHDSYDVTVPEGFDPSWHKKIADSPQTEELYPGSQPLKVYRRYL